MRTVFPVGTTIYKPGRCANGYTIHWRGHEVKLIDMNGRVVNAWTVNTDETAARVDRAKWLPNGNVLVQRGGMMSEDGVIQEYAWDGALAWEYIPKGRIPHKQWLGPHHDVFRKANGNTLLICREAVPESYMDRVRDPRYQNITIYGDAILEVNPAGDIIWLWHAYEHLDLNHYRIIASPDWHAGPYNSTECDWTHVNTVQALPPNKWYAAGDGRFKPGNVMISPRNLDTVYLIDRDTHEVVWEYEGDYFGGLSGQHEPHMIPQGLPGAGNVLIFDNGASPWKDLGHAGRSYVLEIDPISKVLRWVYENGEQFHATYTSNAQRLRNGNTLICESAGSRIFEVTVQGEIVWEHIANHPNRAYRYPYDYAPQTAGLDHPEEIAVIPPEEMRVPPLD